MNIDTFRKKTGLKYKEAARVLGVNPVTLTRWKQRHGGEIPALYKEKMNKALKGKKGNHVPKAPPKVKQERKDSNPATKGKEKEWDAFFSHEALMLKIVDLFGDLPNEESFAEIKKALKNFLARKKE